MINKKTRVLSFGLACIVFIVAFIVYRGNANANTSDTYIPEPFRKSDIPSNIKWNTQTGEYYDVNEFKWNSEIKRYEQLIKDTSKYEIPEPLQIEKLQENWYEKNKNTEEPLDKAIATYYYNNKNGIDIVRTEADKFKKIRSFYTVEDDYNLELITNLGISYIPQMIKKIESNDPFCTVLISAIYKMTNAQLIFGVVSMDDQEYKRWLNAFKVLSDDVKIKSGDFEAKLKNPDINTEQEFKKFIKDAGIFILPSIQDSINKGETQYIKYLPEIVQNYAKIDKKDIEGKDILFWNKWFKDNNTDIEILRRIIE